MTPFNHFLKHRRRSCFTRTKRGIIIPIHSMLLPLMLCFLLPDSGRSQSYCWPNVQLACFYGDMITGVSFANLSHAESVCNGDPDGKKDFTSTVPAATVIPGNTYTLTVSLSVNTSGGARAWIDFNRNGSFEASESFSLGSRSSNGTLSIPISVPAGAVTGSSRLRITNRKDNVNPMPGAGDACHSISNYRGQIKDYAVFISSTNPLPVELTTFQASAEDHSVLLNWSTASEKNHRAFTVERSEDGMNWNALHTLPGHGTATGQSHYSYRDEAPTEGLSYYRLRQSDLDGQQSYSKPVAAEIRQSSTAELYPNPFEDVIVIRSKDLRTPAALFNSQGDMVQYATNPTGDQLLLDTHELPKGLYVLIFNNHQYKFIKH